MNLEKNIDELLDIIEDVCFQFADVKETKKSYILYSCGLSVLEECFIKLIEYGRAEGGCLEIRIKKKRCKR